MNRIIDSFKSKKGISKDQVGRFLSYLNEKEEFQ